MAISRARHSRKKGRPVPVIEAPSEEQVEIFLKTYAEDLCEFDARKAASLTRAQLARLKDDPEFLDRLDDIKADLIERVEAAAYRNAIRRGDKDLIKLLLVAKKQQEYAPKATLQLTVDVTKLTDAELDDLISKHARR